MPAFDAGEALGGPLTYDFTSVDSNKGGGVKCLGNGTIPEPSIDALESFDKLWAQVIAAQAASDAADAEAASDVPTTGAEKPFELRLTKLLVGSPEVREKAAIAWAALCQNSPSVAEITELPPRIFAAFGLFLLKEIVNPKGLTSAT